jgi:dipeptidyl aminopeptidase/acylaminoacyl peptidase
LNPHIDNLEVLMSVPCVEPGGQTYLSPDGSRLAFSWNPDGQWEIFLAPAEAASPPHQLSAGAGSKFSPRWSPDGKYLAYAVDLDGSEQNDIWLCEVLSGKSRSLTPHTLDSIQPGFCWSPDSQKLSFISNRSGDFEIYILPLQGGQPQQFSQVHRTIHHVDWSPDGRSLAACAEGEGQDFNLYLLSLENGEARPMLEHGKLIPAREACWSPDSRLLAFSSDLHGFAQLGLYEINTDVIHWVTTQAADHSEPVWSPDGKRIAFVQHQGPQARLGVMQVYDRSIEFYELEPGILSHPVFGPDSKSIYFTFDTPCRPTDLWKFSLEGQRFEQLTFSLPDSLIEFPFVMPQPVTYPSLDGKTAPALLFKAPSTGPFSPAVVYVHGGPNWLAQFTWEPAIQHMLSRGWTVLAPNYRGSTGYGRAWQLANRFDMGGGDAQDVAAGADFLKREQLADPQRIAVTGRSYGGYLTMACLTQFPDRWAAGSAVAPFINWFTGHANARHDLRHWDLENFGDPAVNFDLYYSRSPYFFLDRIQAPVQMICGALDPRCPASESIKAYEILSNLGKSAELALFEDEGHVFLKTKNVLDARRKGIEFLARVLER